ncbi:MAG: hypothetical protein SVR04_12925 [Spirochaetota bacterium]|nr:hypothetical protein [Spirochaetota bacterium]
MDEKLKLGVIMVGLNQKVVEVYRTYAAVISDENLRKFLRMLLEHKEAAQKIIRENIALLNGMDDNDDQLAEQIRRIVASRLPIDTYRKLPKIDFLHNLAEYEREMEKFLDRCYHESEATEREDLFYSLLEDTKTQRALLRDRYELEQLQ